MQYRKVEGGYFLRLEKGEEVLSSIAQFAAKENIHSGVFFGLGAINNFELGYYDLKTRKYEKEKFAEDMEVGNITGNIASLDGKPFVHTHVTVSGQDLKAYTGHLFSAEVALTLEIFVFTASAKIERKMDAAIGLNLLDL
ncbi:MAG: DNA-binding protein [candidate division Zixibacteria bacterium]|nr:DNA-binding protein [candidate division Zixibacteria bacterium]MCI0595454.1 DNA-binding protein [candidate division Zixibacteria bacterium]